MASTTEVVNSARAIASLPSIRSSRPPSRLPKPRISSDTRITAMMPMPEIGLLDDPTSPAM
ncbi:hypothetical protein D3C81_745040 [compost metagenome]